MGKDSVLLVLKLTPPDVGIIFNQVTLHASKLDTGENVFLYRTPVPPPTPYSVPRDARNFSHQSRVGAVASFVVTSKGVMNAVPLVARLKLHSHYGRAPLLPLTWFWFCGECCFEEAEDYIFTGPAEMSEIVGKIMKVVVRKVLHALRRYQLQLRRFAFVTSA